jgi:hypothetical protein
MMLAVAVVGEENVGVSLNIAAVQQTGVLPNVEIIVLVKALDVAIALGMTNGTEDQLCPCRQSQAKHLAQDARMGEPTTEAGLVIHLGVSRNADLLPDVYQEGHSILRATPLKGLSRGITRNHVNGIETGHRFASCQEVGHNINLAQLPRLCWTQMRIICFLLPLSLTRAGHLGLS